jgi:hypothetical protein
MHTTDGMSARREELRIPRWADTFSVRRNIFMYKAKITLSFAYNKANTNTKTSFYIVRSSCPLVHMILYVYLVYIRPFRNLISRNLGAHFARAPGALRHSVGCILPGRRAHFVRPGALRHGVGRIMSGRRALPRTVHHCIRFPGALVTLLP